MSDVRDAAVALHNATQPDIADESAASQTAAPEWIFYASSAAFVAIGIPGVSLNAVAVYVYVKDDTLHTPFNVILMTLVLVELFCAGFALPLNASAAATKGWKFGQGLCAATAFTTATAGICSISLLSLLGIQRWLFVAFPAQTPRFNSPGFCYSLLALGWAYTVAVIIGPFISGWAGFKPECLGISCGPVWDDPSNLSYTIYLLAMGYVIPVAIITTSSMGLMITMRRKTSQVQLATLKTSMVKKELRVTKMVMSMIAAFVLVWSPYAISAIVVILASHGATGSGAAIRGVAATILKGPFAPLPVVFAKTSTFVNPILYVIMNPQFQRSFKRVVLRKDADEWNSHRKDVQQTTLRRTTVAAADERYNANNGAREDSSGGDDDEEVVEGFEMECR